MPLRHFECRALGQPMRPLRSEQCTSRPPPVSDAPIRPPAVRSPSAFEECGQHRAAFVFQNTGDQLDTVVEPSVLGNVEEAPGRPGLDVSGTVNDPFQASLHGRACTHHTRFQRDDQGVAVETPIARLLGGCGQYEHLGVGGRVGALLASIVIRRHHPAVSVNQHGPDRNIAMLGGGSGFGERSFHVRSPHGASVPGRMWAAALPLAVVRAFHWMGTCPFRIRRLLSDESTFPPGGRKRHDRRISCAYWRFHRQYAVRPAVECPYDGAFGSPARARHPYGTRDTSLRAASFRT